MQGSGVGEDEVSLRGVCDRRRDTGQLRPSTEQSSGHYQRQ